MQISNLFSGETNDELHWRRKIEKQYFEYIMNNNDDHILTK